MTYTGSYVDQIQGNTTTAGLLSSDYPLAIYCREGETFELYGEFHYGDNPSPAIMIEECTLIGEGEILNYQDQQCTYVYNGISGFGNGYRPVRFIPETSGLYVVRRFGFEAATNKWHGMTLRDSARNVAASDSFFHDVDKNMEDQIYGELTADETYYIEAGAVGTEASMSVENRTLQYNQSKTVDCSLVWNEMFSYTAESDRVIDWRLSADAEGCKMVCGTDLRVVKDASVDGNGAQSQCLRMKVRAGETYYLKVYAGRAKKMTVSVEAPHTHRWETEEVTKKPSCNDAGESVYICTVCGEQGQTKVLPATGHTWGEWKKTANATTSRPAKRTRSCKNCGKKETESYGSKLPATTIKNPQTGTVQKGSQTGGTKIEKGKTTKKIKGLKKKLTIKKGKTIKLKPVLVPSSSRDKITYKTSNRKVASVSKKGVVKGKKAGKAKITVKAGKIKFVCSLTVKKRK